MIKRRAFCGSLARGLAALALVLALDPLAARAAAQDPRLAANPALNSIAASNPAKAQHLLNAIDQVLRRPAPLRTRGLRTRGPFDLSGEDEALVTGNPLLGQVFAHDPKAALALLKRVKAAGGGQ
jgi:hypothetical protein